MRQPQPTPSLLRPARCRGDDGTTRRQLCGADEDSARVVAGGGCRGSRREGGRCAPSRGGGQLQLGLLPPDEGGPGLEPLAAPREAAHVARALAPGAPPAAVSPLVGPRRRERGAHPAQVARESGRCAGALAVEPAAHVDVEARVRVPAPTAPPARTSPSVLASNPRPTPRARRRPPRSRHVEAAHRQQERARPDAQELERLMGRLREV